VTNDGQEGIVAKIKATPNQVHLLVADAATYEHFKRSDDHPVTETELFIEVIACHDEAPKTGTRGLSLYHTLLRFDYDTTTIRRCHDALDYDGSDRNYDLRSIRLRYDYDKTMTKN